MEEKDVVGEESGGTNEKAQEQPPVQNDEAPGKMVTIRGRRRRLLWIGVIALVVLVVSITVAVGHATENKDVVNTSDDEPRPSTGDEKVCSAKIWDNNEFDPRIMSVLSSEGDKVTYYGERDEQGIPVGNWTSALVERADGNVHTVIFDETHSPGEIWFSNWSFLLIVSWLAPTTSANFTFLVMDR